MQNVSLVQKRIFICLPQVAVGLSMLQYFKYSSLARCCCCRRLFPAKSTGLKRSSSLEPLWTTLDVLKQIFQFQCHWASSVSFVSSRLINLFRFSEECHLSWSFSRFIPPMAFFGTRSKAERIRLHFWCISHGSPHDIPLCSRSTLRALVWNVETVERFQINWLSCHLIYWEGNAFKGTQQRANNPPKVFTLIPTNLRFLFVANKPFERRMTSLVHENPRSLNGRLLLDYTAFLRTIGWPSIGWEGNWHTMGLLLVFFLSPLVTSAVPLDNIGDLVLPWPLCTTTQPIGGDSFVSQKCSKREKTRFTKISKNSREPSSFVVRYSFALILSRSESYGSKVLSWNQKKLLETSSRASRFTQEEELELLCENERHKSSQKFAFLGRGKSDQDPKASVRTLLTWNMALIYYSYILAVCKLPHLAHFRQMLEVCSLYDKRNDGWCVCSKLDQRRTLTVRSSSSSTIFSLLVSYIVFYGSP